MWERTLEERRAEHRQQEVFGEAFVGAEGKVRVVLETLVGGKAFKADPGTPICSARTPLNKLRRSVRAG